MQKRTLLLIDGHNVFIRSFNGLMKHALSAPDGTGTWGIFGSFNVVANMVRKYEPSHLLIAFDKGRSSKRLAIDPEYKANRRKPSNDISEDEFKPQLATFRFLCSKNGLPYMDLAGVEADDIIANAALRCSGVFERVVIISADHDLHQLVRDNIIVVKPSISYRDLDAEIFDMEAVKNEWGVDPWRLPEIWALMGDKGDNIKGIQGIGPKKATKLIAEHGDLESVLKLDDPKIADNVEIVKKAKLLIELGTDEDLPFPPLGDLQFNPIKPNTPGAEEVDQL